jgi:hypothetical protein
MFALFAARRVRRAASAIDQLCMGSRLASYFAGGKGTRSYFSYHPGLISRATYPCKNGHQFRFGDDLGDFEFVVYQNEDVLQVFGERDFSGFGIVMEGRGRYEVFVTEPAEGIGCYARPLAHHFVRSYGALGKEIYLTLDAA